MEGTGPASPARAAGSARQQMLPFAVAAVLAFPATFLPPDEPALATLLLAGFGTLAVALAIWLVPWTRVPGALHVVPALAYLVVVALLRDAEGGASSGYGPLALLPLFWAALHGRRREVLTVSLGIGLMFAAPVLLVGEPAYPTTEWRRLAVWVSVAPIVGLTVQRLVEQVRTANAQLDAAARTDPLTGLANRRSWDERSRTLIQVARRAATPVSLALLDLDHFKRFNDHHGHQEGDRLLADAATAWQEQLREVDVLARWGGEEFVVLLWDSGAQHARTVLERLRAATPRGQTVSVGAAIWDGRERLADLLGRADRALYGAKAAGRDRVAFADDEPTDT